MFAALVSLTRAVFSMLVLLAHARSSFRHSVMPLCVCADLPSPYCQVCCAPAQGEGNISQQACLSARVDLGAPFDDALQSASKDAMYDASNHIYEDANFVYEDFGGTRLTLLR